MDSSPEDDGAAISAEAAMAKDAAALFQSRRFAECTEVLNQLLQKKEDNPKIIHNLAVAEFHRDGCSNPRKLFDVLSRIKKRSEELARTLGEQIEASSQGNDAGSGSRGSSSSSQQVSVASSSSLVCADEFDTSVVMFNMASVLYQLHEYAHAFSLLEPVYQNIEPIDEATALHVCLLLLDVALVLQDASKAADVIQYLERSFGLSQTVNQGENGSSALNQSSQGSKVSGGTSTIPTAESTLERTLSDEALEYENLISTLDNSGPNVGKPPSKELLKTSIDRAAPTVDLKLSMQLCKVRLLLLTKTLNIAKKEVKLAMNIARGGDSSTPLLLKAQLEYARGNHRKAVKLLSTFSSRTEPAFLSVLNNNLGCIYFQLRQHNAATIFVSKALRSSSLLLSEKPVKLFAFAQNKSVPILYNLGLHYLTCGKPVAAARCFFKAVPFFSTRPLLWLRLAECCFVAQEKGLLRLSSGGASGSEDLKLYVCGSGRSRQIAIEDINCKNKRLDSMGEDGLFGPDDQCRLSLTFAHQCLLNALHLLKSSDLSSKSEDADLDKSSDKNTSVVDLKASALAKPNNNPKECKAAGSPSAIFQSCVSAYDDMRRKEGHVVKQAVLADLAYLELNLDNPLKALSYAIALSQLRDSSKLFMFLSHVYAAEALCHLNRPKEAAGLLSEYVTQGGDVMVPYSDEDRYIWRLVKAGDSEDSNNCSQAQDMIFMDPKEARGLLLANLASTFAMEGNYEQASKFIMAALSSSPNNHPRINLAAAHVDLLLGKTQDALARLKLSNRVALCRAGALFGDS